MNADLASLSLTREWARNNVTGLVLPKDCSDLWNHKGSGAPGYEFYVSMPRKGRQLDRPAT